MNFWRDIENILGCKHKDANIRYQEWLAAGGIGVWIRCAVCTAWVGEFNHNKELAK